MPPVIKPTRPFSDELLSRYRQQGDPPADAVVTAVAEAGGRDAVSALMRWLVATPATAAPAFAGETLTDFFTRYAQLPPWADPVRMGRGMALFGEQAGRIGLILGTYSLPFTYLGADGVQLLWLTERIKNDTFRRLQETGDWVFAVNNPKNWPFADATRPVGDRTDAVTYTLKIRLIHAASRWFGLGSGRWNMAWGMPVNQEDMAGTNLAFSYIVLLGLRRLGVRLSEEDEEDYLHHINVVGYLNGVADELLPLNLREAYQLSRAIARRQFRPSAAGVGLTKALLDAIARQATTPNAQPGGARPGAAGVRNLAAAQMRYFLGDEYADALGIPAVPLEKGLVDVVSRLPLFSGLIPVPNPT